MWARTRLDFCIHDIYLPCGDFPHVRVSVHHHAYGFPRDVENWSTNQGDAIASLKNQIMYAILLHCLIGYNLRLTPVIMPFYKMEMHDEANDFIPSFLRQRVYSRCRPWQRWRAMSRSPMILSRLLCASIQTARTLSAEISLTSQNKNKNSHAAHALQILTIST